MTKYYFYLEEAKKQRTNYNEVVSATAIITILYTNKKEINFLYKISKLYFDYKSSDDKNNETFIQFLSYKNSKNELDSNIQEIINKKENDIDKILLNIINSIFNKITWEYPHF